MAITMTPAAEQYIIRHLSHRGHGVGICLGLKTTGCSGLSYVLEFVDQQGEDDQVFSRGEAKLFIDPKSLAYLDGTELDFFKEGLNEGFQFRNPNVKEECGCGESFHI
ncbi:MAG: iron-sulfur cluster assembly protein IscA [Porticoccus sp.]|nr:MAG: iron-sulfur cluster assembly protein IscA [Porticoccus sp.]